MKVILRKETDAFLHKLESLVIFLLRQRGSKFLVLTPSQPIMGMMIGLMLIMILKNLPLCLSGMRVYPKVSGLSR
jgi:hypothetical protein